MLILSNVPMYNQEKKPNNSPYFFFIIKLKEDAAKCGILFSFMLLFVRNIKRLFLYFNRFES